MRYCENCGKMRRYFHLDAYCLSCARISDDQYHYYQKNQDIKRFSNGSGYSYCHLPSDNIAYIYYPDFSCRTEIYVVKFYISECDLPVRERNYTNEEKAHRAAYLWCLLTEKE